MHGNLGSLDQVFFTDESWIHPDRYINLQNRRIWSSDNPHAHVESGIHLQKSLHLVCYIPKMGLVGPSFFDDTITTARYQNIVQYFIALLNEDEWFCYLQQDKAPAHRAGQTLEFLKVF